MTLEELKEEATKLGYKVVPIKKYIHRLPCTCGQKYGVDLWVDVDTSMWFYKCPKCGLKGYPSISKEGAKLNWNRKVDNERFLLNCPNCGAPIQDDICPYYGSVFLDWASIDMRKPTFVKIKDSHGYYRLLKIIPRSIRQTMDSDPIYCYADNEICQIIPNYNYGIEATFDCLPFKHPLAKVETIYQLLIDPSKADDDTKRKFVEEDDDH